MKTEHPTFEPTKFIAPAVMDFNKRYLTLVVKKMSISVRVAILFSGKEQRMIDTTGRVEKFRRRYQRS